MIGRLQNCCRLTLITILLSIVTANSAIADHRSRYGIVGQPAPALDLNNWIDGEGQPTQVRLSDQRGKVVLLYFFQHWCPGCHSHGFPTLQTLQRTFKGDEKVVLLAVQTVFEGHSYNSQDKVRVNQLEYDLTLPMAHDAGDHDLPQTMRNYRSGGTPWKVIIDPDGTVVYNDFHIDVHDLINRLKSAQE